MRRRRRMGAVFTCKVIANKLNSMINCSICAVMLNDASCMEESNQEYESILHIVRLLEWPCFIGFAIALWLCTCIGPKKGTYILYSRATTLHKLHILAQNIEGQWIQMYTTWGIVHTTLLHLFTSVQQKTTPYQYNPAMRQHWLIQ